MPRENTSLSSPLKKKENHGVTVQLFLCRGEKSSFNEVTTSLQENHIRRPYTTDNRLQSAKTTSIIAVFIDDAKVCCALVQIMDGKSCGQNPSRSSALFKSDANRQTYWFVARFLALRLEFGPRIASRSAVARSGTVVAFCCRSICHERRRMYHQ